VPRDYFVNEDETTQLDLSDGDWIEVRNQLGYGEQQRLAGSVLGNVFMKDIDTGSAKVTIDLEKHNVERLFAWVVDWSFRDNQGKKVKVSRSSIARLLPDMVEEIDAALTLHMSDMANRGNALAGKIVSVQKSG